MSSTDGEGSATSLCMEESSVSTGSSMDLVLLRALRFQYFSLFRQRFTAIVRSQRAKRDSMRKPGRER